MLCRGLTPASVRATLERAREEVQQAMMEMGVRSLERQAAEGVAAPPPPPLSPEELARLDDEALGEADDVQPEDIVVVRIVARRGAALRAAGADDVLRAAGVNFQTESEEPTTDVGEPFVRGLGYADAVLWADAVRAARPAGIVFNSVLLPSLLSCSFLGSYSRFLFAAECLNEQQRAAFLTAAATRAGFACTSGPAVEHTRSSSYLLVDNVKMHVRAILASLCGRPRSSKDRVLRVQQQTAALTSQPDEGAVEPDDGMLENSG